MISPRSIAMRLGTESFAELPLQSTALVLAVALAPSVWGSAKVMGTFTTGFESTLAPMLLAAGALVIPIVHPLPRWEAVCFLLFGAALTLGTALRTMRRPRHVLRELRVDFGLMPRWAVAGACVLPVTTLRDAAFPS